MSFVKNNFYRKQAVANEIGGQIGQALNPQFNTDQVIGGITGGLGLYSSIRQLSNSNRTLNSSSTQSTDAYGRPDYNFGQFASDTSNLKPHGSSFGQILSGGAQGAAAGSAFGPVGTAVGGAIGLVGTAIGGGIKKNKEDTALHRAQSLLSANQNTFNQNMQSYNQNYLGRQAYEDQLKQFNLPISYI